MWVRLPLWAPIQNSTAFSKPEGGTREARPKDSRRIFQTNSEFLARWRALIFRQGGGSSQRFLWHRPFSHKQSKTGTGRSFCSLAEQDDSIPPPSLWAKKLFELRMITACLVFQNEATFRDT